VPSEVNHIVKMSNNNTSSSSANNYSNHNGIDSSPLNGAGGGAQNTRAASHAGSWYSDNPRELDRQLSEWLERAGSTTHYGPARAIIAPHAGYTYCGETAAYAFRQIVPERIKRIFVLGPSHVVYLSGCALTTCAKYQTPLGDLVVDVEVNAELMATEAFEAMGLRNEEAEHSLEMQMPFIAKVMEHRPLNSYRIVPILVGSLSVSRQAAYGRIFAKYIADPQCLFVVSSDFCHWGSRFRYTPTDSASSRSIHEYIAALDQKGMDAIATLDPAVFNDYLKKTQNTICGRNPICVMIQAAEHFRQMNNHTAEMRFLKYSQSNKCRSMNDSSVSYAAGALFINPKV
jgi:AmmeMemoRadiSam system protein B